MVVDQEKKHFNIFHPKASSSYIYIYISIYLYIYLSIYIYIYRYIDMYSLEEGVYLKNN